MNTELIPANQIGDHEDLGKVRPGILKTRDRLVAELSQATTLKQLRAVARQLKFLCAGVNL